MIKTITLRIITLIIYLLPITLMAQQNDNDSEKMEIPSSKQWLDLDYVGDGHVGHRLDIFLPEKKA